MGTIAEKLEYLTETKQLIADAVNAKGGEITPATPFREYADKIEELPAGIVDKKVFNMTIDQIFGSVDENGKYIDPTTLVEVDLAGVKTGLPEKMFSYWGFAKGGISKIYAPDLEESPKDFASFVCGLKTVDSFEIYCPKLTKVADSSFAYLISNSTVSEGKAYFGSLEEIGRGVYVSSVFHSVFRACKKMELVQRIFPKLMAVYGNSVFSEFLYSQPYISSFFAPRFMFPNVEEFYGSYGTQDIPNEYSSVFGTLVGYVYLPKCVKVPTWMFRKQASNINYNYLQELHFAIKNRAAIEACNGFDNNFGASGVFFDLVSAITVNDVVYQRSEDDSITETFEKFYTAWKSDNGDIVYTYDGNYTVEPAVGTDVFSDGGQTVIGTVSAIE